MACPSKHGAWLIVVPAIAMIMSLAAFTVLAALADDLVGRSITAVDWTLQQVTVRP